MMRRWPFGGTCDVRISTAALTNANGVNPKTYHFADSSKRLTGMPRTKAARKRTPPPAKSPSAGDGMLSVSGEILPDVFRNIFFQFIALDDGYMLGKSYAEPSGGGAVVDVCGQTPPHARLVDLFE